jgi:hypothetical protein
VPRRAATSSSTRPKPASSPQIDSPCQAARSARVASNGSTLSAAPWAPPGRRPGELAVQEGEPLDDPAERREAGRQPRGGLRVLDLDPAVAEVRERRLGLGGQRGGVQAGVRVFHAGEVVLVVRRHVVGAHHRPERPRLDAVADGGVIAVAPGDRALRAHGSPFTSHRSVVTGSKPSVS